MKTRRIIGLLLAVCLMLGITSVTAQSAVAADKPAMSEGASVLNNSVNGANAQTVYFGQNNNSDPGAWVVIGYDGSGVASESGTVTLLAAANMGQSYFDGDYENNHYAGNDLQSAVNAIADKLTVAEKNAVKARDLETGSFDFEDTDCVAGDKVTGAVMWPLSTKEAGQVLEGIRRLDGGTGRNWAIDYWRLRSPGNLDYYAAVVEGGGDVSDYGYHVGLEYGVRPAFNVNLTSVLFTSAAEGGKSSGAEGAAALKKIEGYSGNEWKLTVLDSSRAFKVTETAVTTAQGGTIELNYTGATVYNATSAPNEYISAVIYDADGNLAYYGRLARPTSANGKVSVTLPSDLTNGSYTLKVFSEQCNGDKMTDYASTLSAVTVTVSDPATAPTITTQPTDLSLTYGYSSESLSVAAGEIAGHSLSYKWYSCDDTNRTNPVQVGEGATYAIPTGKNAGTTEYYYCVVTATRGSSSAETASRVAAVSVGKRSVTLTSATAEKEYDGTSLTDSTVTVTGDGFAKGEGATYNVTGSQTKVGGESGNNTFTYTLNEGTKASNYDIRIVCGTLTVKVNTTEIKITSADGEQEYSGSEFHKAEYVVKYGDKTVDASADGSYTLPTGDRLTITDTSKVKDVSDTADDNNEFTYVLENFDQYSSVSTVFGKLTVKKAGAPALTDANRPAANDLTENGSDQALVTAPETVPEGYTVQYSTDGENWSDEAPAGKDSGEFAVQVRYTGDSNHESFAGDTLNVKIKAVYTLVWLDAEGNELDKKTYVEGENVPTTDKEPTKAEDADNTYTFDKWDDGTVEGKTTTYRPIFTTVPKPVYTVAGDPASYTLGTSADLTVTVNRVPDDDKCFDHFTGVELDGKALTEGTDFTAAKGSTVVTVKATVLETLAEGEHTVKVLFDDGEVETKITVKAAEQTSPATGDGDAIFIWVALMAVSGAVLMLALRKKRA